MIQNDQGLCRTHEALLDLFLLLAALNRKRDAMQAGWYEAMAEPITDHIFRLRRDIDQYLGLPREWQTDDGSEGERPSNGDTRETPEGQALPLSVRKD
jgi:hypothetical protein